MEILENNSEISCVINEKIKRVWERGANRVPLNFDFVFAKTFIYIYIYIYIQIVLMYWYQK
jgi:hypothetical protein